MKTMSCYSTMPWFNPFWECEVFEPMLEFNDELSEDFWETAAAYRFDYSLPKFRKKDVKIELRDNVIYIKGSLKQGGGWWKMKQHERLEHQFTKMIQLSDDMDAGGIRAKFKHGKLRLEIAKKRKPANVKEIPVFGTDVSEERDARDKHTIQRAWSVFRQKLKHVFKTKSIA